MKQIAIITAGGRGIGAATARLAAKAGNGVAIDYAQRAELNIANTVFGGRFTSMLNNTLRVESGLTYGARSSLTQPSLPGSVAIYSFTKTDSTIEAIDMAIGVLERLFAEGVSGDMLDSAKNYILGQYAPRLETSAQLAGALSMLEHLGLDAAFINENSEAVGFVGASSLERMAVEESLTNLTKEFKSIPCPAAKS